MDIDYSYIEEKEIFDDDFLYDEIDICDDCLQSPCIC